MPAHRRDEQGAWVAVLFPPRALPGMRLEGSRQRRAPIEVLPLLGEVSQRVVMSQRLDAPHLLLEIGLGAHGRPKGRRSLPVA